MNTYDLIMKKRDGGELSCDEINYIVDNYTKGSLPDYQMAAFLMAVYFQGMNYQETTNLTLAMADSGDRLDLSGIKGRIIDKHSTGGVGDKTTLIVAPILAALDVPVAKMSGRGLGHTGGTIDKLEAIPGFQTTISEECFVKQVNDVGLAIVGQTANLAPADKKIYALRDVTATVDNISLIAASIMSKKLAAGADGIVLDVKCGTGAFMKNINDARLLAKTMVKIGEMAGRETVAVISDMNEPLGSAVGNVLEVKEAIMCLKGVGDSRLMTVSKTLACHMLLLAGKANDEKQAYQMIDEVIASGTALDKFKEFVFAQGGNTAYIDNIDLFPKAKYKMDILGKNILPKDKSQGFLSKCNNQEIGMASLVLGGGRETKESEIDLTVGLTIHKRLGDKISADDVVFSLYGNDEEKLLAASKRVINAYEVTENKDNDNKIIYDVITKNDI